jgi:predicted TIM-barrel fold metal-dependent hydrolase
MQIVDAHHHIWRQAALPWLAGPMQPRIFGPYEPIRRDYPVAEFLADLKGSGVQKSVYVQANWADPLEEADYVTRAHDEAGFPNALVAYADLLAPDVRPALDRLARYELLRGIRMQIHWHENPLYRFAAKPDVADDEAFRRNFARLEDYGLSFELQVFAPQMESAARLAHDFPRTTFILQHCGMPEDLSETGMAAWRTGMKRLAAEPNIVNKLSGLGTFIHRNDPDHIARIVQESVALFGPSRCLYGSNFPIEKIWTDYPPLLAAFRAALAPYPAADQEAMLSGTATRVYRLT